MDKKLRQYLINTGWENVKNKRDFLSIFVKRIDGEIVEEVMVPHDATLVDYKSVMEDTIAKICRVEGRSGNSLMKELLEGGDNLADQEKTKKTEPNKKDQKIYQELMIEMVKKIHEQIQPILDKLEANKEEHAEILKEIENIWQRGTKE